MEGKTGETTKLLLYFSKFHIIRYNNFMEISHSFFMYKIIGYVLKKVIHFLFIVPFKISRHYDVIILLVYIILELRELSQNCFSQVLLFLL
jgi:hypothetical protein